MVLSRGKVSEKSGNFELDIEWQTRLMVTPVLWSSFRSSEHQCLKVSFRDQSSPGSLMCRLSLREFTRTLYLIETPFKAFANRADPDQAAPVRAA